MTAKEPANERAMGGRPTERILRDMHELMAGHEFKDSEEVNAFLAKNFNGPLRRVPDLDTPEKQAQDLVYAAWEAPTDKRARALAEAALDLDPECADALVVLAGLTEDIDVALRLLEKATSAAEKRLGPGFFEENDGHFWGEFSTRPYMRARFALAQLLWDTGEDDDAIAHAQALLNLNPNDNQGVRDVLAGWLLFNAQTGAAARLLRQFDTDDSAAMAWARALQAFQAFARTKGADEALDTAMITNPAVAMYLLGIRKPPAELPQSYSSGSEEEAVYAAFLLHDAWHVTQGALEWLVEFVDDTYEEHKRRTSGRRLGGL